MIELIPAIIKAEFLAVIAGVALIVWARVFWVKRAQVIGCISRYDALIVLFAVLVSGAFELLILLTNDYHLAVALSRVMRLWGYVVWVYIGWRQLNVS